MKVLHVDKYEYSDWNESLYDLDQKFGFGIIIYNKVMRSFIDIMDIEERWRYYVGTKIKENREDILTLTIHYLFKI